MMDNRDGLSYREDYFDDPAGWAAVGDLVAGIFGVDISPLDRLGGHDPTSMPSAYFDAAGRCVANFTAFSMPLLIGGRYVDAAGLQSGAVRPAFRGRGLFRDLVRRTLARCDARGHEAIVLYTDKPALYEPYGFVSMPEHRFVGPAPVSAPPETLPLASRPPASRPPVSWPPVSGAPVSGAPVSGVPVSGAPASRPPASVAAVPGDAPSSSRTLDMGDAADLVLMRRLLAGRTPVSHRLAVVRQAEMFLLNTVLVDGVTISFLPALDAAVAWRTGEGGVFELLDIVAAEIPTLAALLQALATRPAEVAVLFPPDRIGWEGEARRERGELHLMVRAAPGLLPQHPLRLSPMAEF